MPSGPPRSPTRWGCAPTPRSGRSLRSAWPCSAGWPGRRSRAGSRPRPSRTPSAPPRWPVACSRPPTGSSTPARCSSSAGRFAEIGDPVGRAWLRGTTAFVRMLAGRLREARRLARFFLPFGERVGEAWAVGTLRSVEAFAAAEVGELAEADREARRSYRDFAAADDDWGRGLALVVRGVVARGLGEPSHAADLLSDALGYGEKTGHPLLIGMARTIRGFVFLDQGRVAEAEADARAVLAVVEPHDVLESAQVGPRVLLAMAFLGSGNVAGAVELLRPVAALAEEPSLLFPRRQAVASYALALLSARSEE